MRSLLLITVCETNADRIVNQINHIQQNIECIIEKNITPVLVCGTPGISIPSPDCCDVWVLDAEERYTNLYKKIFMMLQKASTLDYDYIIKIDDDTLFNFTEYNTEMLDGDYIGRMHESYSQNKIDITLPMYNIKKTIQLYPSIFNSEFSFATGDCYILSKKAVDIICAKSSVLNTCKESEYICEDQLIGYILKDESLIRKDITLQNEDIETNVLQITEKYMSIHPVHTALFSELSLLKPKQQAQKLIDSKRINFLYRKSLLNKLENDIKKLLLDFANSKKTMGLG